MWEPNRQDEIKLDNIVEKIDFYQEQLNAKPCFTPNDMTDRELLLAIWKEMKDMKKDIKDIKTLISHKKNEYAARKPVPMLPSTPPPYKPSTPTINPSPLLTTNNSNSLPLILPPIAPPVTQPSNLLIATRQIRHNPYEKEKKRE